MYLYIYDSFLSEPKYSGMLSAIERRIADLDIRGRVSRLSVLKNIKELVSDAIKAGYTTIIAVGDDQTFAKVINVIANYDVTFGIIPADGTSTVARVLGVPPRELACDVIAARIVKRLDLGKINNYYFLNAAEIQNAKITILCNNFTVSPTTNNNIVRIANILSDTKVVTSDPTDGILEAIITPIRRSLFMRRQLRPTVLPFTKLRVIAEDEGGAAILTDNQMVLKTPADVEIAPQKIRIIVGTKRLFA